MARIRTIKPEFPQSESMGRISRDARLLFILLWTIADDSGRARGSSRMLASLLTPYDDDAPALMDGWLLELEREGCIRRYDVDGSTYVEIVKWLKHQKIDKPSQSRLPTFEEGSPIVAKPREASSTDLGPRTTTLDLGPTTSDHGPETLDLGSATKDLSAASQPRSSARQQGLASAKTKIATKTLDADFETWFAEFPSKDSPDAALSRYRSVRRAWRATAPELLEGAIRYAAEKAGSDPKYIKTAKNWLNDGDWKNRPRQPLASTVGMSNVHGTLHDPTIAGFNRRPSA